MVDRTGRIYGMLKVISLEKIENLKTYWKCVCECGTVKTIRGSNLNIIKSCGCLVKTAQIKRLTKHGGSSGKKTTPEYNSWRAMNIRCTSPNLRCYKHYGGRGITVCAEWRHDFNQFFADMGKRPNGFSLDRIDTNKGYSKENCRWASQRQQMNNIRSNIIITFNGVSGNLAFWAKKTGIPTKRMYTRYLKGWSSDIILSKKPLPRGKVALPKKRTPTQ